MPSAMLRFSGGNARPSTPDTTEKVTPESPVPIRTPAVRTIISGVAACAIVTRPRPYRMVPPINTRPAPYLSATIPTNGCVTPQTRFCTASARAKVSRPQCRSALIGCRNKPKP